MNNLNTIELRFPLLYAFLNKTHSSRKKSSINKAKQGGFYTSITHEGKEFYLESKYNPEKEAKQFVNTNFDKNTDVLFVFGSGCFYHIEFFLSVMGEHQKMVVIEPDPALFLKALEYRNIETILLDKRVNFFVHNNVFINLEKIKSYLGFFNIEEKKAKMIALNNMDKIYPEYFNTITLGFKHFMANLLKINKEFDQGIDIIEKRYEKKDMIFNYGKFFDKMQEYSKQNEKISLLERLIACLYFIGNYSDIQKKV